MEASKNILSDYKVAFMGQTGRGKSSLINALFGTKYPVNSVVECTTFINTATILNADKRIPYDAISVLDTPGIGASLKKDKFYRPYYLHTLAIADCIVWLSNMERTDYADQTFFMDYSKHINRNAKLIVCINQIDKFSPQYIPEEFKGQGLWDDEKNEPSDLLKYYIYDKKDGRIEYFREKFDEYIQRPYDIIPTNAFKKYGIENLRNVIFGL